MNLNLNHLKSQWNRQWGNSSLLADRLKFEHSDKFLRLYSLPEAKRYADNNQESEEIIRRQNVLISELVKHSSDNLFLIVPQSTNYERPTSLSREYTLHNPQFWMTILEDENETDPVMRVYNHVFISVLRWSDGIINDLLKEVNDGQIWGVIIATRDFSILYHPYDGGSDMLFTSKKVYDKIRTKYSEWL